MLKRILFPLSIILLGAIVLANTSGLSKKTINQTSAEIISLSDAKMHEATGVSERNTVLKKQSESKQVKQNNLQKVYKDINGLNHYSPQIERVELNLINKIHVSNDLVNNNTSTRDCDAGYIDDCSGDGDCCPESWIGDGFADCEDQAYGCDLTCYDNDGGDCEGGTGGGDGGGSEECTDCEFDFTNYGSECCDTAWDEYGISCADLEANYSWDCSGCNCPGDGDPVCGDGVCNGDESYETCPEDCNAPGECDAGYVTDCADDDCCPESWIGDGFADCEDQAYGCDLTCYDNDGGDCEGGTGGGDGGGSEECTDCAYDFTPYGSECCDTAWYEYGIDCATLESNYYWDCTGCECPGDNGGGDGGGDDGGDGGCGAGYVDDCSGDGDCCPESWIGDGFEDCEDQAYGCDLTCYDNDGGDCSGGGDDGGGDDGGGDGGCDAGYVDDCSGDGDCCPESWIGDGFADCEDQAYGCDLTCYDNDGGDCEGGTGGGDGGGSEECTDCAYDFTPYGSECCDTAWYEYGIDCATLESNYYWDCTGCECPGDNGGGDGGGDGGCDAGYVDDCSGDGDCCPESWIGDGFEDCEDQAYGCDLTCYDNDGGDCSGGGDGGGDGGGTEECSDCLYDFTPYGSECCDTAWYEYGIDCATLESNYYWDCSGCGCPGDGDPVCGDGVCNGDETYESCPQDCNEPGTCDPGYVVDCDGTDECWPESWIGDGFADCQDQQYGADLTCYDCDGGDCPEADPGCGDTGEVYGCTDPDACNYDPEATMDDGSCAEFDECGECGGDGPSVMCDDGSYVCDASECPQPEPDVYIIAGDASVDGNMAYVSLSYESSVDVAGIQFTISDEPDVAAAVSFDADDDVFMASANDADGDVTGVFFSISGASLPPTDGAAQFAVLTYELSSELESGDVVALHFTDVVCSSPAGTSIPAAGVDGSISSSSGTLGDVNGDGAINVQDIILIVNLILDGGHNDLADVNGDGSINVQDIILIVNMILDSRAQDASEAEIIRTNNELILKADGFIGAVQMTLTHDNNFALNLTKDAMVADYRTSGNTTTLVVVVPEDEVIFTHSGDFEIAELIVVNGSNEIEVSTPAVFSLGAAYPNPFNPSTSIALDISEAGNVNVTVYNLMGQGVATLAEGYMQPGVYHLNWDASQEVSGMYLVRAEAGGFISTQKLLLIK